MRKTFSSNSLSGAKNNTQNTSSNNVFDKYALPSKTRGAALGSSNKPVAPKTVQKPSKSTSRKEEEVVGNMRYIYEIDESGKRTCIRKLPVRNNTWMDSSSHVLE